MAQSNRPDDRDPAIQSYLESPSSESRSKAAAALTEPYNKLFRDGGSEAIGEIWGLWMNFHAIAATADPSTPEGDETITNLVLLVRAIKDLGPLTRPDPTDSSKVEVAETWSGKLWSDLPFLGPEMREEWNKSPPRISADEWAHKNFFVARLTAMEVHDFALYGVWALRDALEKTIPLTPRDTESVPDQSHKPEGQRITRQETVDDILPAAISWLEACGDHMFKLCEQNRSFFDANKHDPSAVQGLAKEAGLTQGGYNLERWKFWRSRLEALSQVKDDAGGREKLAKVAYHGLEKMKIWDKGIDL